MNNQQKTDATRALSSHSFPWIVLFLLGVVFLLLSSFAYWRSSGVGSQVQVPMFYDAHYLFPRPWTQEQSVPGIPAPSPLALYGDNTVSQSFTAGSDQLSMISMWMAGPQDSPVLMTLTGEDSGSLWNTEVTLSSGYNGDEYLVSFPAIPDSGGRRFTLTLMAQQATADQPLLVNSVGGDRLGDSVRLNEFIRPGNLAIATYAKGTPGRWWFDSLGEQLLPAIFRLRIQQYKSQAVKSTLFSWLLLITAGLSAVLLVLASPLRHSGAQKRLWRDLVRSVGWFLVILLGSFLIWQVGSGRAKLFVETAHVPTESVTAGSADQTNAKPRLMADLSNDLWTAVREPEARFISTAPVHSYPAIRVPGDSRIQYALTVPPDSHLRIAQVAEGEGSIRYRVRVNDESLSETELVAADDWSANDLSWQALDLSSWAGQGVVLSLETSSSGEDAVGLWLMPQIVTDASWLLTEPLDLPYLPVGVRFDESAELFGVVVDQTTEQSAHKLAVQLLWNPLQVSDRYGKVFVHLIDGNDRLVAQHDGLPVGGAYPSAIWQPGTIIQDEHVLQLDQELSSGPYRLEIGIYDPDSLQRWTAESADGSPIERGRAVLGLPPEVLP